LRLVTYRVPHRTHRQAWSRGPWHAPERTRSMATCRMASRTIPEQMISSVCRRAKTQMVLREANKCGTSMTRTPADASNSSELNDIIIRQVTAAITARCVSRRDAGSLWFRIFTPSFFPRGVQMLSTSLFFQK